MENLEKFDRYIEHLCAALEHKDRNAGLQDYCRGLMLPIHRKSVEPLAAHTDPLHAAAKHQSLHHFVAKAGWSDRAVMTRIRDWVVPHLGLDSGCYWIVDDTGFPKKGRHSVGVTRQYCGQLGKQDNCQGAVTLSIANHAASLPVAYRLYLPQEWAPDPLRRDNTGGPNPIGSSTHPHLPPSQHTPT